MAAARGVKRSPSTAFIVTTSPMPTACPPSVRAPAAGSGSELMTMESSVVLPSSTRKSACVKEMAPVTGPFLEKAATVGAASSLRKRSADAGSDAESRTAASAAAGSARRRRTRCFKGMTSLFGRDCSHSLCQRKENMQPGRTEDLRAPRSCQILLRSRSQLGRLRILMLETTPMAAYMVTMEEPP